MFIGKVYEKSFILSIGLLLLTQITLGSVIRSTENADKTSTKQTSETKTVSSEEKTTAKTFTPVTDKVNTTDSINIEEIEEKAINKFALELANFTFYELNVFTKESLHALKEIAENVIQDIVAYEGVNQKKLLAEIEPFQEFVTKLQKHKEVKEMKKKVVDDDNDDDEDDEEDDDDVDDNDEDITDDFKLLENFAETLDSFNTTLIKKPNTEVIFIEKLLKKHNFEMLVNKLEKTGENVLKRFKTKAQEIWQSMPVDERGSNKIFDQWLENFEKDSDILDAFKTIYKNDPSNVESTHNS